MSRHASLATLAASAALILSTAACGGSKNAPETTAAQPSAPTTSASTGTAPTSSASSAPTPTSTTTTTTRAQASTSAASGGTAGAGLSSGSAAPQGGSTPTTVKNAMIDSTWKITNESTDLCKQDLDASGTAGHSAYSKNPKTFSCGPMAASLLACSLDATHHALCIQDYEERVAVRFPTKVKAIASAEAGTPTPLHVKLANGQTCVAQSHDQAQHYDNRASWLWCGNDGVLLLPKGDDGRRNAYFTKNGNAWTAQLSVKGQAPKPVGVTSVVYAA